MQHLVEQSRQLVLDGIAFSVAGREIVKPVNLSLPIAGRTVVLGPNGAGKSTLLQLLHGMLSAGRGSVRVHDPSVGDRPVAAHELGFVLQKPVMLARSALDNVRHALAIRGVASPDRNAAAQTALDRVGLGSLGERPARRLSGGEQQRLAIARVIAASPSCLLLDEPTAHLDPGATAAIERLLSALSNSGLGLIMSTHDLGQARRLADLIVFMHRGEIVEFTAASQFFGSPSTDSARRFLAGELLD
jgi:tungstate transport system ATP-binding protein